jgi:tRNA1(Val) A37 N6-methylase TrmN6
MQARMQIVHRDTSGYKKSINMFMSNPPFKLQTVQNLEQAGNVKRVRRREQFVEEVLKELFERARNDEISPGGCRVDELEEAVSKEQYLQIG